MMINELEQLLADYCVNELTIDSGKVVRLRIGIGTERGDDPIIMADGDTLEEALNQAFNNAREFCARER